VTADRRHHGHRRPVRAPPSRRVRAVARARHAATRAVRRCGGHHLAACQWRTDLGTVFLARARTCARSEPAAEDQVEPPAAAAEPSQPDAATNESAPAAPMTPPPKRSGRASQNPSLSHTQALRHRFLVAARDLEAPGPHAGARRNRRWENGAFGGVPGAPAAARCRVGVESASLAGRGLRRGARRVRSGPARPARGAGAAGPPAHDAHRHGVRPAVGGPRAASHLAALCAAVRAGPGRRAGAHGGAGVAQPPAFAAKVYKRHGVALAGALLCPHPALRSRYLTALERVTCTWPCIQIGRQVHMD